MKNQNIFRPWYLILLVFIIYITGCQTTPYYQIRGLFGTEKKELMTDSVKGISESLYDAVDEFQVAALELNNVLFIGNTEEKYEQLNDIYDDCRSEADCVKARIQTMEEMASEFFKERRSEISQYTSESLRTESQKKYDKIYREYTTFVETVKQTKAKFHGSLAKLNDQVMFLKHNKTLTSTPTLKDEFVKIGKKIDTLIKEIKEVAIKTDNFVVSID